MTSTQPPSTTIYDLPNLVMLEDDSRVDELKALTQRMHDHLQRVRFQVFLGELYRQWPSESVDSVRFSFQPGDERSKPTVYAGCEGSSKTACDTFRHWIHSTSPGDEGFLELFEPLTTQGKAFTRSGMESLWRTFVGPEAVAQHLDANLESTQGQAAPKPRM